MDQCLVVIQANQEDIDDEVDRYPLLHEGELGRYRKRSKFRLERAQPLRCRPPSFSDRDAFGKSRLPGLSGSTCTALESATTTQSAYRNIQQQ